MKRITFPLLVASLLFVSCGNNETADNDKKSDTSSTKETEASANVDTPPMDSAAMMEAWMKYATPGDPQAMLAKANGTWTQEITMWMDPNKPPTKSVGTAVNKMILGGRYQQSINKGSFDGMPFEGISTVGYDNAKKVFQSSWVDNMGTGMMNMEGTWDEGSKTINFKGKAVDPSTGKEMEMREVFKMIDDNTQHMEMFCTQNGKEMKTMEIHLTKKS